MACYHPMLVYRSKKGRDPKTGHWPVVFNKADGFKDQALWIPCGDCIGCRLERSRQWAIRCIHESKEHIDNCFITLTYDNDNLIRQCGVYDEQFMLVNEVSLNKRDFQLFMKRLRKKSGVRIRFFHCGEYGERYGRPHHHAIIFGYDFKDKLLSHTRNGEKLYESKELNELWRYGKCVIGNVTFKSAAYVARYIMKKVNGKLKEEFYDGMQEEYVTMSRKPGIGKAHFDKYRDDYLRTDTCVINGLQMKPPRFYDKIFDVENKEEFRKIKIERSRRSKEIDQEMLYRLLDVEKVKMAQTKKLIRTGVEDD